MCHGFFIKLIVYNIRDGLRQAFSFRSLSINTSSVCSSQNRAIIDNTYADTNVLWYLNVTALQVFPEGIFKKHIHAVRAQLGPAGLFDDLQGFPQFHPFSIGPVTGQRVERISYCGDARP